jgi:hypothetical protein
MSKVMEAGARKISMLAVKRKGVDGMIDEYSDVKSWRLGYNGILTVKGDKYTEVYSLDEWDHISVTEN